MYYSYIFICMLDAVLMLNLFLLDENPEHMGKNQIHTS
jgi:hypothetical protein